MVFESVCLQGQADKLFPEDVLEGAKNYQLKHNQFYNNPNDQNKIADFWSFYYFMSHEKTIQNKKK